LNGLSPRDVRWWLDYLRELQAQQAANGKPLTFIVTSDDFRDWLDLADHFALIQNDKLHVLGNREQLLANKDAGVLEFL
jgi:ABC-type transporter Mla maintaining outer membrane lipid asymmetry ATPase subunit MlaF